MVSSSPEYSITKPGVHHHLRKRDKPLRTYGRRTIASESNAEPPSKKPRLGAAEEGMQRNSCTNITAENNGLRSSSSSLEPKTKRESPCTAGPIQANARKGSIMSYFKLAPPKRQTSSPPQSDTPPEETTDETLLVTATGRRKPRLLKIRAIGVLHEPTERSDGEEKENDHVEIKSPTPSTTNNYESRTRRTLAGAEDTKPNGSVKSKTSSTIQTTLNISARAAFSECKICDTVWNPLYPDDVKYHTKRHKAVLRARMRKVDEL